jgi:hypothetical protein
MKKTITILASVFTICFAMAQSDAAIITNAASISNGDLLLGFDVATNGIGTQKNLLIDLGQYASLGSLGSIDLSADLTAVYGSSYATYGIKYGVIGVTDTDTIYLTTPTQSYLYAKLNSTSVGVMQASYLQPLDPGAVNVGTLGYDRANSYQTTTHGGYITSTDPNSWSTQNPTTAPFGFYAGKTIETTLGSSPNYLDIMPVSTSLVSASQAGYFNVTSLGVLTYTAVPEPSTYALMALGSLILVVAFRRKKSEVKTS